MKYAHLTPEQQVQMLTERLLQIEAQHYECELNKARLLAKAEEATTEMKTAIRERVVALEDTQVALDIDYATDLATREELQPTKVNDRKVKA